MTLRNGAQVHAALVSETGAVLGSTCRYRGVMRGRMSTLVRVACDDLTIRYFPEKDIHLAEECPYGRLTHSARRR